MPTLLPAKTIVKRQPGARIIANCVLIWAISLGVAAAATAMFVFFGDDDQVAATFILCAAAFLIHLAIHATQLETPPG